MSAPILSGALLCRRTLLDAASGHHTLVDVLTEIVVSRLPADTTFDVYLQLRRLNGDATLVVEVSEHDAPPGDVLGAGTVTLGAAPSSEPAPAPPALGVALPGVRVTFVRGGEHLLRVRTADQLLGEHSFFVVDGSDA